MVCVQLYGVLLCVLDLCVWLVVRVSALLVTYCVKMYVLLLCSFVWRMCLMRLCVVLETSCDI